VNDFVACKACKKVYSFKAADGTQTLRKHSCGAGPSGPIAKTAHPQQKGPGFDWAAAGFAKSAAVKRVTTVPESTITNLNRKTVLAAAIDFRPLSFAQCSGFQMLAQELVDIGAKHGSVDVSTLFNDPTAYSRRILPNLAAETRAKLINSLSAQFGSMPKCLSPAAFVGDHWTDKYRQIEFTSIAVSFVDENFNLQSYDLCVREYESATKHAPCIRDDLIRKLKTYLTDPTVLDKVEGKFVFVSDSDPKLVAALREDFDRQSCAVHDLSLAVKAALKAVETNSVGLMIEDCKVLVRHVKKTGMNRKLSKTLKQDVSTRFNSVYTMLQSIDDVFDEVTSALTESDNITYLANIKRKTLKSVCKELKRFDEATLKLAVEKEETLHLVVPILHELKSKMVKQAAKYGVTNPEMSKLCNELAKTVGEKCTAKLTWYQFAAAFLNPEYRSHEGMVQMEAEVDRVRLDLKNMVEGLSTGHNANEPAAKKIRTVLCDSDTESENEELDSQSTSAGELSDEFNKYMTSTFDCDDGTMQPLQFWKCHAKRFPVLSQIARSVYGIPATQNKSERAFSAASHVMTDLRTTLDPEHLDELLLIRSNYKHSHE